MCVTKVLSTWCRHNSCVRRFTVKSREHVHDIPHGRAVKIAGACLTDMFDGWVTTVITGRNRLPVVVVCFDWITIWQNENLWLTHIIANWHYCKLTYIEKSKRWMRNYTNWVRWIMHHTYEITETRNPQREWANSIQNNDSLKNFQQTKW